MILTISLGHSGGDALPCLRSDVVLGGATGVAVERTSQVDVAQIERLLDQCKDTFVPTIWYRNVSMSWPHPQTCHLQVKRGLLTGNGCRGRAHILRDKDGLLASLSDSDEDTADTSGSLRTRGVERGPQHAERVVVVPRRVGWVLTVCVNPERGQPR
jgi:hypothetical protein